MSRPKRVPALGLLLGSLVVVGSLVWMLREWQGSDAPLAPTLEEEIAAFGERERGQPSATGAVLFTGSSSIRRWASLALDMQPLPVVNHGFGGSQLADLVRFHAELLGDLEPSAVVVYAGDNDLDAETSKVASDVLRDFRAFVRLLWRSDPELPVFFLAIKPSLARWSRWPEMRSANERIADWCVRDPRLSFVDVATPLLSESGEPRADLFLEDGLHLNAAGYSVWSGVLRPVLLEALPALTSASNDFAKRAE